MRRLPTFALVLLAIIALIAGCTQTPTQSTASGAAPQARTYHLFTSLLAFNETTLGIPHDTFTPDLIVAHKGDTLTVVYHNLEDTTEHHTFTMDAPYAVDKDVAPNESVNITFTADTAGVFTYVCKYHQPTMTGHVLVLG